MLRQFFFSNGINEFMYFRMYCPTSYLNQFFWNLINTWRSVSLQIYNHNFSLKGTRHSVVCISACLGTLTWRSSNNRHKWFFHLPKYCQNLQVGHKFSCRLAIFLKFIYAHIQVYNFLFLLFISKSLSLPFKHALFLFLKNLLVWCLIVFRLLALIWLGSCKY
jgi:hypothetical protein